MNEISSMTTRSDVSIKFKIAKRKACRIEYHDSSAMVVFVKIYPTVTNRSLLKGFPAAVYLSLPPDREPATVEAWLRQNAQLSDFKDDVSDLSQWMKAVSRAARIGPMS